MRKHWLIVVYLAISIALALVLSTMFASAPAATAFDSPLPKPAAFLPYVLKLPQTAGSSHDLSGDQVFSESTPAP
jgi:hypothetical protein